MLVPESTLGWPLTAPVFTSNWSTSVVLPEEPCPQTAMLRMSWGFLTMLVSCFLATPLTLRN
jgi:hypothetical protein